MPFRFVLFTLKGQVIVNGASGKLDFLVGARAAAGFPGPKDHQEGKNKDYEKGKECCLSSAEEVGEDGRDSDENAT